MKEITGPTNGKHYVGTETIRGNFGTENHKKYGDKYTLWANGFHCADSKEDVEKESPLFFQDRVLKKYGISV